MSLFGSQQPQRSTRWCLPRWRLCVVMWYTAILCFITQPCATASTTGQNSNNNSNNNDDVDLPFGDINVMVLTDVHSWVGGHSSNEPNHNADYGDVLSFYERLRAHCQRHNMDVWFVVNGDWIDGTGLSMNGDISYLTPLLERMPWDALNVGNHELYRTGVVEEFMRPGGFVEWWGDRYLSSNVLYNHNKEPLGERYRFLRGQNATVLTFGFLYDMTDASSVVTVQAAEKVVEEEWFVDVVTNAEKVPQGYYDAILVLSHMDFKDHLVSVLLNKIRDLVGPTMPVQFITGHTHIRAFAALDEASVSFEAGRYLDTIGFVSFPKQQTLQKIASNRRRRRLQQGGGDSSGGGGNDENEGESSPLLGPGGTEWPNVSDANSTITTTTSSTVSPTAATTPATTTATTRAPTSPPSSPEESVVPVNVSITILNATPATNASTTITTFTIATPASTTSAPTAIASNIVVAPLFHHRFIDTDVAGMAAILGEPELTTNDGQLLSDFILRVRKELGLLDLIGCTSQPYYLNRTIEEDDSVWRLYLQQVAPYQLLKKPAAAESAGGGPSNSNRQQRLFLGGYGGLRYDLLGRALIVDDVIAVDPFNETIYSLGSPGVPGSVVVQLITQVLNKEPNPYDPKLDTFQVSPSLEDLKPNNLYEIMAPEWGVSKILNGLDEINYNGTVKQVESGFFTTDVWLDFVKQNWQCHDEDDHDQTTSAGNSSDDNSSNKPGGLSSSDSNKGGGVHTGYPYEGGSEEDDKKRLILAGIGVGMVVILGAVYIWQLHESWLVRYRARQRLILIADQENDNELI